jgi:hypothetical protein
MRNLRSLLMVLGVGLYYALVVMPLDLAIGALERSGSEARKTLVKDLAELRKKTVAEQLALAALTHGQTERFSSLRFTEPPKDSLDILLRSVQDASQLAGGTLRNAVPISPIRNPQLELEGIQCDLLLPSEPAFSRFVAALRSQERLPSQMFNRFVLRRQPQGLTLDCVLTFLRRRPDVAPETQAQLDAWKSVAQNVTSTYPEFWLLEPRPLPPPPRPEPARQPVASHTMPPPPPPQAPPPPEFSGRLVGLASAGGKDLALLDTGGTPALLEQGQTVGSWVFEKAYPDRIVLKEGSRESTVWFSEQDRQGTGPQQPAREPPPPPQGAQPLGLTGQLVHVGPDEAPPSPFERLRRVFRVRSVAEGSSASNSGLRPGDLILTVDGAPLATSEQIVGLRARLARGESCDLDVERNRSIVRVALSP